MGARISNLMSVGQRAMMNAQTGLHTVGHNIANKETEGFSRQRTETVSNFPMGSGKLRIGMGARAAAIRRINNPYLEKQILNEGSDLSMLQGRQQGLTRLEQVYNEQMVEGFSRSLTNFFNAWRELSTGPESMPRRTSVKESALQLVKDFKQVDQRLSEVSHDIDTQISLTVSEINTNVLEIAELNQKVMEQEIQGGWANDERDRRDLLLKKLAEKIDIKWSEGDSGMVTVQTAKDAILVAGNTANRLEAAATPGREGKEEAAYDIVFLHHDYADPLLITDRIQGGRLGGLLSVRKAELFGLKRDMDNLAFVVANQVNNFHQQGYNAYNQTGVMFFNPLGNADEAAKRIDLSGEIQSDVGKISAGADPNRAGDNRIANGIAEIQYRKALFNGKVSLDEFYNGLVGELGIKTNHVNNQVEVQDNIVRQLNHMRESISGVSLDEEAARMIELQKHFDASARLIRTADEVLETVINLKRY